MSIIENIKNYISTCPLLKGENINVNYLGAYPVSYTIDNLPEIPVIRRYCDGGTLRQYCFAFASRDGYDSNSIENMRVAEFFENFAAWIDEQNKNGVLPEMPDKKLIPEKIEVIKSGYVYDTARTSARFQVQLRLVYRQEV